LTNCRCGKILHHIGACKGITAWNKGKKYKEEQDRRKKLNTLNCLSCGRSFRASLGRKKFCSLRCYWNFSKGKSKQKRGKFIACIVCGKQFYAPPFEKDTRQLCSHECDKYFNQIHLAEIQKQAENLTNQGFRCILPDVRPRPDIIAIKDNKVFAVEVEFGEPDTHKYDNITVYNDIWWMLIKNRKVEENQHGNGTQLE
jgi:predicted nucleic acid-binding Zn ribbon protein